MHNEMNIDTRHGTGRKRHPVMWNVAVTFSAVQDSV
jgi:hypothetical protein